MSAFDWIGQQILFSFDPETAHGLSIAALRCGLPLASRPPAAEGPRRRIGLPQSARHGRGL